MRSHLFTLALVAALLLLGLTASSVHCNSDEKFKESLGDEILDEEFEEFDPSEFEESLELAPKEDYPPTHALQPAPEAYQSPLPPLPPQAYSKPQAPAYTPPPQTPAYPSPPPASYQQSQPPIYPVPKPVPLPPLPTSYSQQTNYVQAPPAPPVYVPQNVEYSNFSEYDPSYQVNYQASNFSPPPYGNEIYQNAAPQQAHQAPQQSYQAPQQSYQAPQQSYQAPQQSYQAPQQSYQAPQQSYQAPQQSYQAPQQSYQPPVVQNYSAPQQTYQAPQQNYQAPQQNYQAPQQSYQAPQQNYQAPQQSYQPPVVQNYSAPAKPAYQPPVKPVVYQSPKPPMVPAYKPPVVTNYSPQALPQQHHHHHQIYMNKIQVANYSLASPKPQMYQPAGVGPIQKYSLIDLAPFIPLHGYLANHWSLFYYRASPYRTCPKNVYLNPPSYKDVEAAFAFAQAQLGQTRGNSIQFLDASQPSWAGRHQVFSFLNQQSARMDEEGLLVELVSQYLSDRACLTKWDKQRYLPTITKFLSTTHFPNGHSCSNIYKQINQNPWGSNWVQSCLHSKYRTFDGFCNNIQHPYWGKANVCHIRLLSPDYADGISSPRNSYNPRFPLPNPRLISNYIHNDIPIEGPYNLMKMQWGQFINHDITNTALSAYDGLVDCCKNPNIRGCWPIYVPPGDRFYGPLNVTCLSFIRSGVCPLCELGPRQQVNKNTAFLDASHVYGNNQEQANQLRMFKGGLLKFSVGKNGEILLPVSQGQEQCVGVCFQAGDNRVNQHPALTALHTLLLRNHNHHARALAARHPQWPDEIIFQEARRINIAEYQMITYNEYLPIVFGPILSSYYKLLPNRNGQPTFYEPKADPTTWNEYSSASCRFGHSQITSTFGLYNRLISHGQSEQGLESFRLKDWFMRPSLLSDGLLRQIILGLVGKQSYAVDPWITTDVHDHLYEPFKAHSGGDLAATNIWRGRDHGIPGYVHYVEYCFNHKVRGWHDLAMFIPPYTLNQLRKLYKVVENIDLFTGGLAEFHFPGADTGPTFACINGIQYYHLKFGDRYWFEHANQAGSFTPQQLEEIKRTTLARLLCRTAHLQQVPQYAFLQPSVYNPIANCSQVGEIDYGRF